MKTMTLAEVMGEKLSSASFTGHITRFDPIEEVFYLDGINHLKHSDGSHWVDDPCFAFRRNLSEFGIEVKFSLEEQKMLDEAKLTAQVAKKSAELLDVISAWLNRPGGR